jgi:hypothetical protein
MRQLDALIDSINTDLAIVLIPDKFQVSEEERQIARTIIGTNAQDNEFRDLFEVNARITSWIGTRHPDVKVYDIAKVLRTVDARQYYYRIDGHMTPAGARLLARSIVNILE